MQNPKEQGSIVKSKAQNTLLIVTKKNVRQFYFKFAVYTSLCWSSCWCDEFNPQFPLPAVKQAIISDEIQVAKCCFQQASLSVQEVCKGFGTKIRAC